MINQYSTKSKSREEDFESQRNKIVIDDLCNSLTNKTSNNVVQNESDKTNLEQKDKHFYTQNTKQDSSPFKKTKRLVFKDMIKIENNKNMSLCEIVDISYNDERKDFLKLKSISSKSSKAHQKQNKLNKQSSNLNDENCSCVCVIF